MNILAVCPAPQAGPELLVGIRYIIAFNPYDPYIIAFNPYDPVVFDMQFQRASSAAIKGGCRPHNFYITHKFLPNLYLGLRPSWNTGILEKWVLI
jgi:hypothetical protein